MDIYRTGMTAMRASSTRLSVTATNLVNANTPGYKTRRVHTVEMPGGGVSVTVSRDISPGPLQPDPEGLPGSSSREGSNVDLAREMIDLTTTQRYFQANARALRTMAETRGRVLDIVT